MSGRGLTPPQTAGPFFHGLIHEGLNVLVTPATRGERIRVEGHVSDGNHNPVADAAVEIWQANARGGYRHPGDQRSQLLDPAFQGFGRAGTDDAGYYWFETIKPGPVSFAGHREQAPHLNVVVFARGLLNHLCTRMYFQDDAANDADPVLRLVPEDRRATLVAKRVSSDGRPIYRFDIVLQGEEETVFFDL